MDGSIGIVIVNYNGEKYQNDALRTIYASEYKNFEVIIVDSASKDKSIALAKEEYPDVHYLLQNENVGVAKGNNIGMKYAIERLGTDYILLLNNDILTTSAIVILCFDNRSCKYSFKVILSEKSSFINILLNFCGDFFISSSSLSVSINLDLSSIMLSNFLYLPYIALSYYCTTAF